MSSFGRLGQLMVGVISACALLLGGSGCGGDDSPDGSADAGSGETAAAYEERLDRLYEGTHAEPTGPQVSPEAGKNIWVVSLGQNIPAAVTETDAVEEAGRELGWDVTVFDGQFDPNRMLEGVEQALADGADGIVLTFIDCPAVKPAIQRAQRAGVHVVATEASDCSELQPGDPELFDWVVHYGDLTFREWIQDWGAAQSTWVIAETDGRANAIVVVQTDAETTRLGAKGELGELDKCSGCSYTRVDMVGADFGPPLQQKIEQALIKNPDANAFIAGYDALLTSGGGQALKASGRLDELAVMGGEGSVAGIQLVYDGVMDACVGIPPAWEAYAAVDALIRLFAGRDPGESNSGIGLQVCDRDHSLPPEGEAYESPIDYAAAYREIWGVD